MSEGRLTAIWLKRAYGGRMDSKPAAVLDEKGLVDNANRGGKRQVTLISQERWDELMQQLGANLSNSARRANLVLSGIDLEATRGRTLSVGGCTLYINGETRPCEMMDDAFPGLQDAMRAHWGGGVFAEVVKGGPISVGDPVSFVDTQTRW